MDININDIGKVIDKSKINNLNLSINFIDIEKIFDVVKKGADITKMEFSKEFEQMISDNGKEIIANLESANITIGDISENLETIMNSTQPNKIYNLKFEDVSIKIGNTDTPSPKNETHADFGITDGQPMRKNTERALWYSRISSIKI